jgi:Fe-S cluster assembly protein SufD
LRRLPLAGADTLQLVFLNGRYSPEHSTAHQLPSGLSFRSLRGLLEEGDDMLSGHLARYAGYGKHAFTALNTAFVEDGALLHIARGALVEQPVLLLFVTAAGGRAVVSHPRVLVLAERESQASVIELYASLGDSPHFTNAVTEAAVEEGAILEHYRIQMEAPSAYHVATAQFHQERSSTMLSHNVSFGGSIARNDITAVLDGEGAECTLNGLYLAGGNQHVDNHTTLDHARPHCASREYYKGILDGKSTGVFNGKIIVREDAQKTDAIQSNKNLLLSADAVVNTKPQLEIWADDVRCTHGATVGQLDLEAIFYLRSRGISREAARELLTYAFAADVLGRMKVKAVRERLEKELFERLK